MLCLVAEMVMIFSSFLRYTRLNFIDRALFSVSKYSDFFSSTLKNKYNIVFVTVKQSQHHYIYVMIF